LCWMEEEMRKEECSVLYCQVRSGKVAGYFIRIRGTRQEMRNAGSELRNVAEDEGG
jgi:hypothetical protein